MRSTNFPTLFALITGASCVNFPFESTQLQDSDVGSFSAIAFGDKTTPTFANSTCKTGPGNVGWPLDDEWSKLNSSLNGALLKPAPPAIVCYPGPLQNTNQCNYLLQNASSTRFYINDPVTVLTDWPEGNTCLPTANSTGSSCTQGGFPTYVVNATTVRHIQIAVNFARNKGIRLIIKNTGHDFVGRSAGAGSISVWTHYLKSFEYLPDFTAGEYRGRAARVGSGLEAWELYNYMDINNMTVVVPGGSTVGAYGGWTAGGGHTILASYHGLGADQPLSIQVVTADGRFVTADMYQNTDLFYALRGGGPGSYGIVTSMIVKAYPAVEVIQSVIGFSGGNLTKPAPPLPGQPGDTANIQNLTGFWNGVYQFYLFGKTIVDNGGTTYNYIAPLGNNTYSFTTTIQLPGLTPQQAQALLQPLFDTLNKIGIAVNNSEPIVSPAWGAAQQGEGDSPGEQRFATRLFPRANWENTTTFLSTMGAIQSNVEAGYIFHGIHLKPTEAIGGYPGNTSVNPAFRTAIMHADIFDYVSITGLTPEQITSTHTRLETYVNLIRAATPGSGAYVNECDLQEPNFQQSFWGDKYAGLLKIKQQRDPWDLFWSPATVGSEGWEVKTVTGLPTQNGPLCRVPNYTTYNG
ncbi:hypothetical protein G7Y89_g12624 [Cudoniella acicularis]|uniref:FAD-binding PCMH-type domain-containing protein n=1 Tax=Cudoniella acicularis TaxID=354080 RepID=A0A8H4RB24_9HELO|nr:hypothetical protein G7Y89_g12624 [Cudoniella acicularis]